MSANIFQHLIGVHIGDGLPKLRAATHPANNWVGMRLLNRLLSTVLIREALSSPDHCAALGELNDCVFLAHVSDPASAVEKLKVELEAVALLHLSQIGIREGNDWRCVHSTIRPELAQFMPGTPNRWFDTERLEAATEKVYGKGVFSKSWLDQPEGNPEQ